MALNCSRTAFSFDDPDCPSVDVDLTFPEFEACEDMDTSRLKGPAKLAQQKTPVFPVMLPAADSFPVHLPDFDFECPFDDTSTSVVTDAPFVRGSIDVVKEESACVLSSVKLTLTGLGGLQAYLGDYSGLKKLSDTVYTPFGGDYSATDLVLAFPVDATAQYPVIIV